MRIRRTALMVAVVVGLALMVVSAADASFALKFNQAKAKPGAPVTAIGVIVWPNAYQYMRGVVVYLVSTRLGHADYNTGWSVLPPPGSKHTYAIGAMTERNNRAFLRFTMPLVPPGDYMTAFWCPPSYTHCDGRGLFYASALWNAPWTGKPGLVIRVTP